MAVLSDVLYHQGCKSSLYEGEKTQKLPWLLSQRHTERDFDCIRGSGFLRCHLMEGVGPGLVGRRAERARMAPSSRGLDEFGPVPRLSASG